MGIIDRIVNRLVRKEAEQIETILEMALLTGTAGASIIHYPDGITVQVDEHVPYGQVYDFPSREAYEAWEDRGYPR
jgi:hypothetical protein